MRTIKGLAVPQDANVAEFPEGTLQNQTDTQEGTPVVREIYGDILTNLYKLLPLTGVEPNQSEDSETNGYQLVEALQKMANVLNDIEQVMTLTATQWTVPFEIDNLPDKYVFVARVTSAYNDAENYTFKGTDDNVYNLTSSTGFNASDDVLVIIDQGTVRVIGLTTAQSGQDVCTVFGTPLQFNDSSQLYYEEEGNLVTDIPSINLLQSIIRVAEGDGSLYVYNMFVMQGHVLCFCWLSSTQTYKFYQFAIGDLTTAIPVSVVETSIPVGVNEEPYAYTDGSVVYLTNQAGNSEDDFELSGLTYDPATPELNFDFARTLANTFTKTTNAVIQGNELVTFASGQLRKYDLTTGNETNLGDYNAILGQLFRFNGQTYYSNGEIAKQWSV